MPPHTASEKAIMTRNSASVRLFGDYYINAADASMLFVVFVLCGTHSARTLSMVSETWDTEWPS